MNTLILKLLGTPEISLNGYSITNLISRKAQALLIYVAVTGKQHSREMLAELFWQNMPSKQSMKNLRTVLPNLRQVVGSHLIITRQSILFNRECSYCLDVEAVQALANYPETDYLQSISEAVMQYQGDFLEGFYVPNAPDFENWALIERERLRELAITGLHTLAEQYLRQQNYATGLAVTRRLLALDPWRETAHQQQMIFLTRTGQRRAALAQYETCCQILVDEFNVEPMAETTALYKQIRSGEIGGSEAITAKAAEDSHENECSILSTTETLRFQHSLSEANPFKCNWGEAIDVSIFYGRQTELAILQQWITHNHTRLILLLGMGGIGKTALSVKLAQTVQAEFEYVIWRSLRNAPPLEALLADLVPFLSDQQDSLAEIGRLMHWLRSHRCLVIFDNVETILQEGCRAGEYRSGYESYGELFRTIGEVQHQSCILLTSREKLIEVAALEGNPSVQVFSVKGSSVVAQALLEARGLLGSQTQKNQLAMQYGCNPFALKIVASLIQEVFEGNVEQFTKQEVVLFSGIRRLLEQQFERLSILEQTIMYWLAINREWTAIAELTADLIPTVSRVDLLEALESLSWRHLIEQRQGSYTQQPLVMEYVTNRLVKKIVDEITNQKIELFNQCSLLKTSVKEYLRNTQQQLILTEISTQLHNVFPSSQQLEAHLKGVLLQLQKRAISPIYAAGNLINLFNHLHIDLTGYNFSRLPLRHAYLQGHSLQFADFQESQFHTSSFTQTTRSPFSLSFSPDGRLLADGDGSGVISVRQVADQQILSSWHGHTNAIWTLAWSPDGKTFATSSNDGTIRVWNPLTGQCLQMMQSNSIVWTVDWSPDGRRLVSAGAKESLHVWDAKTGHSLNVIPTPGHQAKAAVWSENKEWIVSGGDDGTIKLWHPQTGECLQTLVGHTDGVWSLSWQKGNHVISEAIMLHGRLLASSSADHTVRLWDLDAGQCIHILQGHSNSVLRLAWSSDSGILSSSSDDTTIRLWDVETGQCLRILQGHQNSVWSLAWSQTEPLLASGSADHTLRLWHPHRGDCLQVLQGYSACTRTLVWSSDNQTLAAGSDDHTIRLWHVSTEQCLKKLRGQLNQIWDLSWSPDQQTIAACSDSQAIELWNPHTGEHLTTLRGHTNWIWSMAWSPDSRTLISGSNDQTIRVWDVETGRCLQCWNRHGWVTAIALSPDGKTLVSGGIDCCVWLLNAKTGEELRALQGHTGWIWSARFSADGQRLATGSEDGTVRLWNVQTGECLQVLQTQQGRIFSVDWSPDHRRIACGGSGTVVQIWDVTTGECITHLQGHTSSLWAVAWRPSGQLLASSSDDDIRIWQVDQGECLHILRADRPYEGMNITGATGLTEAQKATLKALGAVEEDGVDYNLNSCSSIACVTERRSRLVTIDCSTHCGFLPLPRTIAI
jgi:WD40 repeat protein/DNA-binding SARP family transcriptional activator